MLAVAGVVDARDDLLDEVLLARHLADQHVVLVVAGHRDHHVGALDPGPLEHPQLGRVAVLDVVLELLLDGQVAVAVVLDQRHLVLLLEQLPREVPADLSCADDDDVHVRSLLLCRPGRGRRRIALLPRRVSHVSLQHLDRNSRRADRVQALPLVPLGAVGVEHPGNHRRHLKRRLAIWAMTMLVLSPSVEAMKASAFSIPA